MEGGRITESGAYAQLIDSEGDFANFIRTFTAMEDNEEGDPCTIEFRLKVVCTCVCDLVCECRNETLDTLLC